MAVEFKHDSNGYGRHHCRCEICVSAKKKAAKERKEKLQGQEPPKHGTRQGYDLYRCRCDACVKAMKEYRSSYKMKMNGQEPLQHGLTGYSIYGCRCGVCVSARKESDLKRKNNPEIVKQEKERGWARIGINGFTWADFCKKYDEQEGKCFICKCEVKKESKKKSEVAVVDHNHSTGKVRALLCGNCNKMIGFARESSTILRLGASYVDLYSEERCL
jgi:hypothetical protein